MSGGPAGPAWFAFRAGRQRRLGARLPDGDGAEWFDLGPLDAEELLADGALGAADLRARARRAERIEAPAQFLAPLARPSKILCLGKNFAAHAAEFGATVPEEPIVFAKLADTLVGHRETVRLPHWVDTRIDHELELGVVLGFADPERRGRKYVAAADALALVAGYTVLNDVTARKLQGLDRERQWPWLRSKSFDTFCPLGPWVVPADALPRIDDAGMTLHVDGELRQQSRTSRMVVGVAAAIEFLARHWTLRPGDLIAMGTPEGVGPIRDGQLMRAWIEGIGTLENPVRREAPPS
jgi:2-keto-4-pentenoate hydratase/2-oxohepta-3-ene-1,7-dioic acid hydratase in catechol pathway